MISKLRFYIIPTIFLILALFVSLKLNNDNIYRADGLIRSIFNDSTTIEIDNSINLSLVEVQNILYLCENLNAELISKKEAENITLNFIFNRELSFTLSFYFRKIETKYFLYKIQNLKEFDKLKECISKDFI